MNILYCFKCLFWQQSSSVYNWEFSSRRWAGNTLVNSLIAKIRQASFWGGMWNLLQYFIPVRSWLFPMLWRFEVLLHIALFIRASLCQLLCIHRPNCTAVVPSYFDDHLVACSHLLYFLSCPGIILENPPLGGTALPSIAAITYSYFWIVVYFIAVYYQNHQVASLLKFCNFGVINSTFFLFPAPHIYFLFSPSPFPMFLLIQWDFEKVVR